MERAISFIHAADLHLDSPFKGLYKVPEYVFQTMRESTFRAFDRLIEEAIRLQVDFVLFVGDLFDESIPSLKAQLHLREGFLRLEAHGIQVYLSYGNHDFMKGQRYPVTYPDNVHIFPDELVRALPYIKNGEHLAQIYGFSYEERAVYANKAAEYVIESPHIPFHIATLHGTLHGNQDHDPYAAFRLEDLQREAFDYWALGHIHQSAVIQEMPPIVYSGNIQGRHRKESGEKGCFYVQLTEIESSLTFIPLQDVQIIERTIDLRPCPSIQAIKERLLHEIDAAASGNRLMYLQCKSDRAQVEKFGLDSRLEELIELINEQMGLLEEMVYIIDYRLDLTDPQPPSLDSDFMKELSQAVQAVSFDEAIADLYRHPQARKHLRSLDENRMLQRAVTLLQEELSKQ